MIWSYSNVIKRHEGFPIDLVVLVTTPGLSYKVVKLWNAGFASKFMQMSDGWSRYRLMRRSCILRSDCERSAP